MGTASYVMGVMGHYVGDATQPLHTTKHYNGWVGDNPEGYTTSRKIHSWIDGGFWTATGVPAVDDLKADLRSAEPVQMNGKVIRPEQLMRRHCYPLLRHHKCQRRWKRERSMGTVLVSHGISKQYLKALAYR